MKTKIILILVLAISLAYSCKKDEIAPSEMIKGKWIITSTEVLGNPYPGNGSYLIFNTDSGIDYDASDSTSGTFTYTIDADATLLVINDTMSDGGNYNFSFDILELNETKMRLTTETIIFGNILMSLEKN